MNEINEENGEASEPHRGVELSKSQQKRRRRNANIRQRRSACRRPSSRGARRRRRAPTVASSCRRRSVLEACVRRRHGALADGPLADDEAQGSFAGRARSPSGCGGRCWPGDGAAAAAPARARAACAAAHDIAAGGRLPLGGAPVEARCVLPRARRQGSGLRDDGSCDAPILFAT